MIQKEKVMWPSKKGNDKRYQFEVKEVIEENEDSSGSSSNIKILFQEKVWEGINI